ncbi:MAG: thiamine-phosphate kinase, partial [Planctomycetota bacterium]
FGVRRGVSEDWIKDFANGLADCAQAFKISLVGGDITSGDGPTSITLTAIGTPFPGGPIRRKGAQAGDIIAVTGSLGGSIHGHHLKFTPRLKESEALCATGALTAMMDLSDGLALDLRRLCRESETGALLESTAIPVSEAADSSAVSSDKPPLHHAFNDGEDFELLFTIRPNAWNDIEENWSLSTPITRIGEMTDHANQILISSPDHLSPLEEGGFVHEFH